MYVILQDEKFRGKGSTNGIFKDCQYFHCDFDCGLFVSLDRVWYNRLPPGIQDELQIQQSASKQHSYAAAASFTCQQLWSHEKNQTGDVYPPHVQCMHVHHPPAQSNLAANLVQPGNGAASQLVDPNLGIGSRIQIPTQSPTEPYRYGVIRWMGEIPAARGLIAGIELVSLYFHLTYSN